MEKPISKRSYLLGLFVIFASAYSQYIITGIDSIGEIFIVYGIPLFIISMMWGKSIIRKTFNRTFDALKFGLGLFSVFTVLGILISILVFYIMVSFDPTVINLLLRPNPVLQVPPELAWVMLWFSLLVVGPVEEYLHRGFVYGGLLSLFGNRHWFSLALISSILFAAVHLYYGFTYGIASLILFIDLIAFGMAMASTYYLSDGNLIVPSILHGTYDATGFIGVVTSMDITIYLRLVMILIGTVVAFVLFIQKFIYKRAERQKTIEIRFCSYCGLKVPLNARFCPSCGKAVLSNVKV